MTNHFDALFEKDVMIGVKSDAKFREHIIIQEEIALTSGTNFWHSVTQYVARVEYSTRIETRKYGEFQTRKVQQNDETA